MTPKESAEFLDVDISTVRKLLRKGFLKGEKRVSVRTCEVVAWEVDKNSVEVYKNNHAVRRGRPKNKQY